MLVRTKRRSMNRLGFAMQLCLLRHPGQGLGPGQPPPTALLDFAAAQLGIPAAAFTGYAQRDQTRRRVAHEFAVYIASNAGSLINYGERFRSKYPTDPDALRCVRICVDRRHGPIRKTPTLHPTALGTFPLAKFLDTTLGLTARFRGFARGLYDVIAKQVQRRPA